MFYDLIVWIMQASAWYPGGCHICTLVLDFYDVTANRCMVLPVLHLWAHDCFNIILLCLAVRSEILKYHLFLESLSYLHFCL